MVARRRNHGTTLYIGHLDGNSSAQYPASDGVGAERGISDLASITSGEYAGMFAALRSGPPSSLTIFTFDAKGKEK